MTAAPMPTFDTRQPMPTLSRATRPSAPRHALNAAWRLLPVLLLAAACGGSEAETATVAEEPTMLLGARDVATVSLETIASGISITGSLDAAQRVEVKSQLAGQLDRITVDRGSSVRRGQLLATIDARGTRAQLASAQASLEAAERDLRAADTLYKAGAISERDFVQASVARDASVAQLEQVQETLSRASVTAPITGVISVRSVQPGEAVQTAAALFTIVNTDSLELAGRVAPDAVGRIRIGQSVALTLDAYAGRAITGRVARIEPVAETGTRQVAVYVHVPNQQHELVGGLFATGLIMDDGVKTPQPAVPTTAVQTSGSESAVYVLDGDRIARRPVTLGERDAARGLVAVLSGVSAGERVLINAPDNVANGTRATLLSDAPPAQTPPAQTPPAPADSASTEGDK